MGKKIEYCCLKKNGINICHHNIKVDDEKFHIIDSGCNLSKDELRTAIENDIVSLNKGWFISCDSENCEEI